MPSQDYSTYNNYNMAPPKKKAKAAAAASATAAASEAAGGAPPTLAGAASAPLAAAAAAGVAPDPSAQPVAVGQLTGMFNQFGAEMMKQIEASLQTKLNGVTAGHDALSDRLNAFINDQSAAAAAGAMADGTAAAVPTVHVFTFTGGPCAGKTTIINELARRLRVAGAAVVVKDEGATADFDAIGGFRSQWAGNVDKLKTLQANMLSGEVHAHEHALAHASLLLEDGRDVLLLCDRSGLDSKAFCDVAVWSHALSACNTNEADLLAGAGTVLHLVSTACDKPTAYDFGPGSSNPARHSDAQAAQEADHALRLVYQDAEKFHVFGNLNGKSFDAKMAEVFGTICRVAHLPADMIAAAEAAGATPTLPASPAAASAASAAAAAAAPAAPAATGAVPGSAGPASAQTLKAAAAVKAPAILEFQAKLNATDLSDTKAVAELMKKEGFKIDYGAAGESAALIELEKWGGRAGAGAQSARPAAVLPPATQSVSALDAAYTGLAPSMVLAVDAGDPPLLLVNLFVSTAASAQDAALGLRSLDHDSDNLTEVATGLYRSEGKTYRKLPSPTDLCGYMQAATALERYAIAVNAFTPEEAANHHFLVTRVANYITGNAATVPIDIKQALLYDRDMRRMQHARRLPLGFADHGFEIQMLHVIAPGAAAVNLKPAEVDLPPVTERKMSLRERVRTAKRFEGKGVCRRYNMSPDGCPDGRSCAYAHVCALCYGANCTALKCHLN